MTLIIYYVIFVFIGAFAAYFAGRAVEWQWGSNTSLIVFLALYFLSLWVAWPVAVWLSKPRTADNQASA